MYSTTSNHRKICQQFLGPIENRYDLIDTFSLDYAHRMRDLVAGL